MTWPGPPPSTDSVPFHGGHGTVPPGETRTIGPPPYFFYICTMDISLANCHTWETHGHWGHGNASGPGTPFADGFGMNMLVECRRFVGYGCGTCRPGRGAPIPGEDGTSELVGA